MLDLFIQRPHFRLLLIRVVYLLFLTLFQPDFVVFHNILQGLTLEKKKVGYSPANSLTVVIHKRIILLFFKPLLKELNLEPLVYQDLMIFHNIVDQKLEICDLNSEQSNHDKNITYKAIPRSLISCPM